MSAPLGVRILQGASLLAFAALTLQLAVGPADLDALFADWVYSGIILSAAVLCATRAAADAAERKPWALLSLALIAWLVGEVHFSTVLRGLDPTPFPTLGEAAFILFYPATYAGIVMLVRERLTSDGDRTRKVSLRATDGSVDVSRVARGLGGGGHRQAAGFSSGLAVPELFTRVRDEVSDQL